MTYLTKQEMYELAARHNTPVDLDRIMIGGSKAEANWNTEARGDIRADGFACSRGLFQMNLCGGQGVGYTPEQLDDPDVQWAHMLPIYRANWEHFKAQGYTGEELAWRVCCWSEQPWDYKNPDSAAAQGYREGWRAAAHDTDDAPPSYSDLVITEGYKLLGIPYRIDPPPDGVNNLDCSLFIQVAARNAGAEWPNGIRTVEQIRGECERRGLAPLDWADVPRGAILFFTHTYEPSEPSQCADGEVGSHIGFSLGAGTAMMLDCHAANGYSGPPGVGETDISGKYWQSHLYEARLPWWHDSDTPNEGEDPAMIAELQSELQEARTYLGVLQGDNADEGNVYALAQRALDSLKSSTHRPTRAQRDAIESLQAALNTLHTLGQ